MFFFYFEIVIKKWKYFMYNIRVGQNAVGSLGENVAVSEYQ